MVFCGDGLRSLNLTGTLPPTAKTEKLCSILWEPSFYSPTRLPLSRQDLQIWTRTCYVALGGTQPSQSQPCSFFHRVRENSNPDRGKPHALAIRAVQTAAAQNEENRQKIVVSHHLACRVLGPHPSN